MVGIKDIMNKKVVTVGQKATVQELSGTLIKNRLSGVPVVDEKKNLVGFVSERDIIMAISAGTLLNAKVKDVMIKNVAAVKENASAEEVSRVFTTFPFRYVPVIRKRSIIGIISRKDVIEKLLGQYY